MSNFPETSYSLIAKVKDTGDSRAWSEFLEIYQPIVYRMARRRGLQDSDANDVVQQVFGAISQAIVRWKQEREGAPFRAWLSTIARNEISKALSRQPKDRASGSTSMVRLLERQIGDAGKDEELDVERRQQIIRWAAEQIRTDFSAQTWDMFWKTSIEGRSISEVAESSGRSVGSVYVARHRVIARLKAKVLDASGQWMNTEESTQ